MSDTVIQSISTSITFRPNNRYAATPGQHAYKKRTWFGVGRTGGRDQRKASRVTTVSTSSDERRIVSLNIRHGGGTVDRVYALVARLLRGDGHSFCCSVTTGEVVPNSATSPASLAGARPRR